MSFVQENIIHLLQEIRACEKKYHRPDHSVSLLAVTKKQPVEKILDAIQAGQRAFGENYLQEALEKIAMLADQNLEWHFIGPIQSNKTKKIAEHFTWVHSVASERVAKRLNDQRPDHLPPLNICLEVNISEESTKSGIKNDDLFTLADYCESLPKLKLRGLMCIPAAEDDFEKQRAQFHELKILYEKLREKHIMLDTLSMGMSDDWQAAIAEGATIVRIGTRLFGAR